MPLPPGQHAIRRRLLYRGQVQGVGFRYTACRSAADFAVAGFVRNLRDGRVEAVVEGEPAELDAFAADLARRMGEFIREAQAEDSPATGEFVRFEVRY